MELSIDHRSFFALGAIIGGKMYAPKITLILVGDFATKVRLWVRAGKLLHPRWHFS